jgi:putative ABC transport system permease protein
MNMIQLSAADLMTSAVLVLIMAALSWRLHVGVEGSLLWSALRSTVQLLLIGMVLRFLFTTEVVFWIGLTMAIMLLVAGREVMVRQQRPFTGLWGYGLGTLAMFVSSFGVTVLALNLVIGPEPWYQPQYSIPLLGMLLGNTMTGIALGLERLTSTAWEQRHHIEAQLILGYRSEEVGRPLRREGIRVGLIPMINAMAAAGVVSLPGMMTGQILAGTAPIEAVKYQLMVMFLISGGTGLGTLVAVTIGTQRLFDHRERLRLDRLKVPTATSVRR